LSLGLETNYDEEEGKRQASRDQEAPGRAMKGKLGITSARKLAQFQQVPEVFVFGILRHAILTCPAYPRGLPESLYELYGRILRDITNEKSRSRPRILPVSFVDVRPLRVERELGEVLEVDFDD